MRTVLACVDLSATTQAVLDCARALALPDGHLLLLHVAPSEPDFIGYGVGPPSTRDAVAHELREEHRRVQELAAAMAGDPLRVTPLTVQGPVVERIVDHATRLHADLIVVASKGRSAIGDWMVSSAIRGLLRAAHVPVVVVPAAG